MAEVSVKTNNTLHWHFIKKKTITLKSIDVDDEGHKCFQLLQELQTDTKPQIKI